VSSGKYTVGALVQANYGDRSLLRVDGVPVGREIGPEHTPLPWTEPRSAGSIIIIVATDAPLLPVQCKRLARRATVGLARVGGVGHNGSGDIFLAFATGNHLPAQAQAPLKLEMLPHQHLNAFFDAWLKPSRGDPQRVDRRRNDDGFQRSHGARAPARRVAEGHGKV